MARTFDEAREWAALGSSLFLDAADLDAAGLAAPSALPGWTRKHLVAHVAANADALGNLVHWAATGERTPMYSSPEERDAGIAEGAELPAPRLLAWLRRSADELATAAEALDDRRWQALVVTAQGRTVPATELPWMRAREVCVHAVDLGTGVTFADLPAGFLSALCDDAVAKRTRGGGPALTLHAGDTGGRWALSGGGAAAELTSSLAELTAYLTGREHALTFPSGEPAPALPPWL
ncbi:maleylpyruvate isomerase family mycothiol-dependent enzyme [Streptomyces xiaopingdaonensis]|uniref:maleylpyruvate isomerase family mycothiol-dependent enzyme n=1 Tax=Streptomyces xiaopingdaonensis TaxID=1565415 RepID=UPI0002F4688B|nr:maleylpyruvate isomerase family mycothiol-dependent enzyme [Streptomyces xiaopingdaonensis]